jgi:signal transduction histidine kinase
VEERPTPGGSPRGAASTAVDADPAAPDVADHRAAEFVHELRQPLATIATAVRTLAEHPDLPPDPAVLGVIERQVQQGLRRLDQLLLLFRGDLRDLAVAPTVVRLQPLVDRVAADHAQASDDHDVTVAIDGTVEVLADPELLEHILGNLLANALRFAPVGSTVGVTAATSADTVIVEVHDEGPGVDRDVADHLFEPFRTGGGGTGLGLAIVRRLVEANGGQVWLEPRTAGGGTTVAFTLPATAPR